MGDMLLKKSCEINIDETGDSLKEKLATLGKPLLLQALTYFNSGNIDRETQDDSLSNYAKKLTKEESVINWHENAVLIDRKIRAFTSAIGTHTDLDDQRIRIHQAAVKYNEKGLPNASEKTAGTILSIDKHSLCVQCGEQTLEIFKIQIPGANIVSIEAFLNGRPDFFCPGQCFSSPEFEQK